MADRNLTANRWGVGLAYFVLSGALMLFYINPIELVPDRFPAPDLLVGLTFAWVLRRPQYVPTLLVALVLLLGDLLFMRPPGLWAALVVLAVEFLRGREAGIREQPFPVEWALVSGALLAITLANRMILSLFLVDQAGLGLTLLHLVATILAYPLVVIASRLLFGLRKMTPGETDARGRPR